MFAAAKAARWIFVEFSQKQISQLIALLCDFNHILISESSVYLSHKQNKEGDTDAETIILYLHHYSIIQKLLCILCHTAEVNRSMKYTLYY
ncbi:hypothetical protein D3C78_1318880 [compost metagenome]